MITQYFVPVDLQSRDEPSVTGGLSNTQGIHSTERSVSTDNARQNFDWTKVHNTTLGFKFWRIGTNHGNFDEGQQTNEVSPVKLRVISRARRKLGRPFQTFLRVYHSPIRTDACTSSWSKLLSVADTARQIPNHVRGCFSRKAHSVVGPVGKLSGGSAGHPVECPSFRKSLCKFPFTMRKD